MPSSLPPVGAASVSPGFTLGVSIPARPQPRASRGQNKACSVPALISYWRSLLLGPVLGADQLSLAAFLCLPASHCADPPRGNQGSCGCHQGHVGHCSVLPAVSSVTQSNISQGRTLALTPELMLTLSPLKELGWRWAEGWGQGVGHGQLCEAQWIFSQGWKQLELRITLPVMKHLAGLSPISAFSWN